MKTREILSRQIRIDNTCNLFYNAAIMPASERNYGIGMPPVVTRKLLAEFFPEWLEDFDSLGEEDDRGAGFFVDRDIRIPWGWDRGDGVRVAGHPEDPRYRPWH